MEKKEIYQYVNQIMIEEERIEWIKERNYTIARDYKNKNMYINIVKIEIF